MIKSIGVFRSMCERQVDVVNISVIMPVYNSIKYLQDAVTSIINQNFSDYELLLVDDGSTDGSGDLCDSLEEKHKEIRVFHQKNRGMCAARNFAISQAKGKYITFCDNDDRCLDGFLKDNFKLAEKYHADCVRFGREAKIIVNGKVRKTNELRVDRMYIFDNAGIVRHYDKLRMNGNGVWNGLYRKKIIDQYHILFDTHMKHGHEDTVFNLDFYEHMSSVVLNPKIYYEWNIRSDHSTSAQINLERFHGIEVAMKKENDYMLKKRTDRIAPKVYMQRIMMYFREIITLGWNGDKPISYGFAKKYYQRMNKLLRLHCFKIQLKHCSIQYRIMMIFIEKRYYHLIYYGMKIVYKTKSLKQNISNRG